MTITRRGLLAAVSASALLSACATITLAEAGAFRVGDAFSVTLRRPWSDLSAALPQRSPGVHLLTIDGVSLNQFYLASLKPGTPLFRPADRDTPAVTYRADMSESELVEFMIDSLASSYEQPEAANLRPQSLAGAGGVRFEISARTAAGLNVSGTALVARAGDDLNLLVFMAPSEHYYGAYAAEVDSMFASAARV